METTLSLPFPSLTRLCLLHAGLSFMGECAKSFETQIPKMDCGAFGLSGMQWAMYHCSGASQERAWVTGGRRSPERRQ